VGGAAFDSAAVLSRVHCAVGGAADQRPNHAVVDSNLGQYLRVDSEVSFTQPIVFNYRKKVA
jgi:hypothetical protein